MSQPHSPFSGRPRKERCENCVHFVTGGDRTEVSTDPIYKCKAMGKPHQPTTLRGHCQHWDTVEVGRYESPRGEMTYVQ